MSGVPPPAPKLERQFCSTSEAAQMIGVSLGTVQQMVENGVLEAWKTAGGHRRIRVASVESFLQQSRSAGQTSPVVVAQSAQQSLRIVIAEDDLILQTLYQHTFDGWDMPLEVVIVGGGFEGLMEIGRQRPDVLISDLVMPGLDGFEMIRRLRADQGLADMDIIVVTALGLEDIEAQGGLPADVTHYGKPVPFRELKGYIQAKLVQMQRKARTM